MKSYQPEASVGADKVHAAPVVLGEEVVVGRDLWGDDDQVVDGEIIVARSKMFTDRNKKEKKCLKGKRPYRP